MRSRLVFVLACTLGIFANEAKTAEFPSKPVTLVVPYGPGGSSDIMGRALAQKLSEIWGQPVIVENKPGATTTIGADYVSRAAPDGYTLLVAAPPFVITQYVYPNLSYDTRKSFEPVSLVAYLPLIFVARASLPVNSISELVGYARSNPGVIYASPGSGTTPHLMGEMLQRNEKLDLVHVPYKSAGQGVVDLVAGRLHFYAGSPTEVLPNIKLGKLRPLAILAGDRSSLLPDVPTSTEAGYGYLQAQTWTTIVAPRGTPDKIVEKISADIRKATTQPDLRDRLTNQGAVFVGSSPQELAAFYEGEHQRFGPIVKAIGLKAE